MKLAIGTAQFGLSYGIANQVGQVDRIEAKAMLKVALANGVNTLDTAIAYGDSETCLGQVGTQGFNVVTKLPALPDDCVDVSAWVRRQMDASLLRLNVMTVEGLLLHRPQQLLEKNGDNLYSALQQLKSDGLVKKIGISIYDTSELDLLCERFQFDLIQAPFNIFDRRLIYTGWMERLALQGVELHVRSAFLQGLLLMSANDRPNKFSPWNKLFLEWDSWLKLNKLTPLEACLSYVLSFPNVSKVIVGADSLVQLKEIILASSCKFSLFPEGLMSRDTALINPANWATLSG